jgi:hypothetical protein
MAENEALVLGQSKVTLEDVGIAHAEFKNCVDNFFAFIADCYVQCMGSCVVYDSGARIVRTISRKVSLQLRHFMEMRPEIRVHKSQDFIEQLVQSINYSTARVKDLSKTLKYKNKKYLRRERKMGIESKRKKAKNT